jgi:putative ABC transport system permease protein
MRSFLSILAVATAVASMALVITGLRGFQDFARETSARAFGSDTYMLAQVVPGDLTRRELADRLARNPVIRRSDVRFLERFAAAEVLYAPLVQRRVDVVAGGRKFESAAVQGTEADMFRIRDLGIAAGRFFLDSEGRSASQLVVLGWDVAQRLFPGEDPLGKTVRIAGRGFRVIGLQERQGSAGGVPLDSYVWMPLRAFERLHGPTSSLQVFAKAIDVEQIQAAEERTRATMRARRQLRSGAPDNFDILTPEAARGFVLDIASRVGAAAGPISFMALLAAVVVVTNTGLVSVAQRTREIGIRRAVGASRRRIITEILTESVLISLAGGLLGVAIAGVLLRAGEALLDFAFPLTVSTLGWSLLAATTAGLLAGLYPARWAASLDVVTALRTE